MIESVNNENVKYFKKLREKKYIIENNEYIVEGEHLVEEAYKSGILKSVILKENTKNNYNVPFVRVSSRVMESISLHKSVPNIMGIVKLTFNKIINGKKIVLLDNVQDPGNAGTIIRSALAFNVDTIIFSKDSVSIYNDKLIRASEGTIFKMNIVVMDLLEAIKAVKNLNIPIYYADMDGNINLDEASISDYALILGSEGQGVNESFRNLADGSIKIDMKKDVESLNVAVSGAIIMYKLR